jgi:hypothetical protein
MRWSRGDASRPRGLISAARRGAAGDGTAMRAVLSVLIATLHIYRFPQPGSNM